MERRNQFRLVISDLVLRLPLAKPNGPGAMQSQPSTFCKIFFKSRSCKVVQVPTFFSNGQEPAALLNKPAAVFDLSDAEMSRLSKSKKPVHLIFELHSRSIDGPVCGFSTDWVLDAVKLPLDFSRVPYNHETQFHGGWMDLDKKPKKENRLGLSYPQLHVSVHVEPDTRISSTFTWGPGPEANLVQPDKPAKGLNNWLLQQLCLVEKKVELRSGWSVTIRNTSGSPVAVASMLVPYVPKMQPLAWLIEQLGEDGWVPWGRLAAWHALAAPDTGIHIRFEKVTCAQEVEWLVNPNQGGTLSIDYQSNRRGGFVFSASVGSEGSRSLPTVEVSAKHIKCVEDAAPFLALAGAINLSVDACQRFI
ncbi:hypothetical protein LUZ63_005206 [Rhynchospora breviuscula]|uniref:Uncharacterized protein n=1 Tax=Rhynchospora breviuscula TaxID=2022672 RepID=A0A9Q0CNL4_9POAL|nr:hypothetical protein LUZ63_005206 [Rhynchospora breviuscula]